MKINNTGMSKEIDYMIQMDNTKTKVSVFNKSIVELSSRINIAQITTINLHEIIEIKKILFLLQDKIKNRLDDLYDIQDSYTLANEYFKEMKNGDSV